MNSERRFVWGIEPNADPVPIFLAHLGKESMMMLDLSCNTALKVLRVLVATCSVRDENYICTV
jgi:hypothetical protein